MVENGAQLVEVLPREAYEAEHLPRAITIPLQQLERQTMAAITQAAKAGYTHVWVHQIGPDQAGFFPVLRPRGLAQAPVVVSNSPWVCTP